jgi:phospholipase/carboxylesterase
MLETDFVAAPEKDSKRLMLVLHGLGDSMEGYRFLPQMLRLPWLNYLLVNAPDAYYQGFSWYDFPGDAAPGVERSREMLIQLLDRQREAGFASDQTILFGFSQGCLMTLDTGLRYRHRLAGLIGISGYLHDPEKLIDELAPAARETPVLITHGAYDPLIPIGQVRPQIELLKKAGVKVEWHEFRKEHTIAGEAELRVIRDFIDSCFAVRA